MLSSLNIEVKTQQYFVSSSDMFLDKKTLFKILVNPRLSLPSFDKPGPGLQAKRLLYHPIEELNDQRNFSMPRGSIR